MKRVYIVMIAILAIVPTSCRNTKQTDEKASFSDFYSSYRSREGVSTLTLPTALMSMMAGRENPEARELLRSLNEIRIMNYDQNADSARLYATTLREMLDRGKYKELTVTDDQRGRVEFLYTEDGDKISELVMISTSNGAFTTMGIRGNIDKEMAKELPRYFNPSTLKQMERISPF